ncbi:DUF1343 domain-containing protein [Halosquirtibacter laminarini]|uniref:DUF1343 domain-containing protein n=1 Tax=Halosquirtibacter laminarini TaxID=3374600 RepID=A0AC61NFR0_9BACT|nr:DUF1343 domain-containing protein [Prolixibacteraceae bacterium]
MLKQIKSGNKSMIIAFVLCFIVIGASELKADRPIKMGAQSTDIYLDELKGERVGVVVNHTSYVDQVHLVDFLVSKNIKVQKIFAPEHGFRGNHSDGAKVSNSVDPKSGVSIVSLYGKHKKPTDQMMQDIDVCVFDIQDVGCRFYTYISTLFYVMESCAKNDVRLIVLDRPNPNGDYVDGPVLDLKYRSFVGIAPIPIVHGCTIGELAKMYQGEKWISNASKLQMKVVPCQGYDHRMKYVPPIAPSPNLPNYKSIRLYPSLCFFEATTASIGRGTEIPFQVIGYPDSTMGDFTFEPQSIPHVSKYPKHEGEVCYGESFPNDEDYPTFTFKYLYNWSKKFQCTNDFVDRPKWMNLLVGSDLVVNALQKKIPLSQWKEKYSKDLTRYKQVRKKYLLYPE